jgi:hypothetical protein
VRTVNFVTLRKLDVRNQKINVTFQKINGISSKMNLPVCPEILSWKYSESSARERVKKILKERFLQPNVW